MRRQLIGFLSVLGLLSACSQQPSLSETKFASLTQEQALEDLEALATTIKTLYGPLEYKEQRFGYTVDGLIAQAEQDVRAGSTDTDYFAAIKQLLASFEDGHVGVTFPGNSTQVTRYNSGVFITPIEGKAVVAKADDLSTALGVAVGDVVVSVDGQDTMSYLPVINKYQAFGNDVSDEHNIAALLNRRFYIKELVPQRHSVNIVVEKADGTQLPVELPWVKENETIASANVLTRGVDYHMEVGAKAEFNADAKGSALEFGAYKPFFMSANVESQYDIVQVTPNDQFLAKYNLTKDDVKDADGNFVFYAALYPYQDKTILLIRSASYVPPIDYDKMISAYRALLDQYDSFADVLVIDQNHNPGGYLSYVAAFYQLFIPSGTVSNNLVQKHNADRKWYFDFLAWTQEEGITPSDVTLLHQRAGFIENALDAGQSMTDPFPLVGTNVLVPDASYTWKKPILVLADELAGSCGDIFPMYIKDNATAKIMGKRTIGLGGNVEEVVILPNSQSSVRLTRGLFTSYRADGDYSNTVFVENNGINPDIEYNHTIADFRAGFVEYFGAVSAAAVQQIP